MTRPGLIDDLSQIRREAGYGWSIDSARVLQLCDTLETERKWLSNSEASASRDRAELIRMIDAARARIAELERETLERLAAEARVEILRAAVAAHLDGLSEPAGRHCVAVDGLYRALDFSCCGLTTGIPGCDICMGCDIHFFVERRTEHGWAAVKPAEKSPYVDNEWQHYIRRDYSLFARLAGVRNTYGLVPIAQPRGLPADVSNAVHNEYFASADWHSTSWLSREELLLVGNQELDKILDIMTPGMRAVFWFDN